MLGASLVLVLDMVNKNDFSIAMDSLDYKLKLGGKDIFEGVVETLKAIGTNNSSSIQVPVNLNFLKMGRAAYDMLTKASSSYELSGNMTFQVPGMGEKQVSYEKKGDIRIKIEHEFFIS